MSHYTVNIFKFSFIGVRFNKAATLKTNFINDLVGIGVLDGPKANGFV